MDALWLMDQHTLRRAHTTTQRLLGTMPHIVLYVAMCFPIETTMGVQSIDVFVASEEISLTLTFFTDRVFISS